METFDKIWSMLKKNLLHVGIGVLGKAANVKEIPRGDEALGYTSETGNIYLNPQHDIVLNLRNEESDMLAAFFLKGVYAHELMHQCATNFEHEYKVSEKIFSKYGPWQGKIYHEIFNIVEDSAIEYFAPAYFGGDLLKALKFTIKRIYRVSPDINPEDSPFGQFLAAMIQYGDMGKIKGSFTSKEARNCFMEVIPVFNKIVFEANGAKRANMAMEIFKMSRSLWEPEVENAEKLREIMNQMGSSSEPRRLEGTGSSPSFIPDEDKSMSKEKARTAKKLQKEKEKEDDSEEAKTSKEETSGKPSDSGEKDGDEDSADSDKESGESGSSSKSDEDESESSNEDDSSSRGSDSSDESDESDESDDGSDPNDSDDEQKSDENESSESNDTTGEAFSSSESDTDPDIDEDELDGDETFEEDDADYSEASLEAFKSEIRDEMASEETDKAKERSDYRDDLDGYNPVFEKYRGVRCVNSRMADVNSELYGEYLAHIEANEIVIPFVNQLERIFRKKEDEKNYRSSGKVSVKRLTKSRVSTRVFTRHTDPGNKKDVAVFVLVDESGSMCGTNIENARKCTVLLAETFARLSIPIYVMGFSTQDTSRSRNEEVSHIHYLSWHNTLGERARLLQIHSRSNNFDGYSVRYADKLLSKRPETHKLLIVISDGEPACEYYQRNSGVADTKNAVECCKHHVIGILIGCYGLENVYKIYGNRFANAPDSRTLFSVLAKKIEREMKGW